MTPLSELITDMGLYDAAMQGLRAERREQVVSVGRGRGRCASMQGVVEEVGRDADCAWQYQYAIFRTDQVENRESASRY